VKGGTHLVDVGQEVLVGTGTGTVMVLLRREEWKENGKKKRGSFYLP